MFGERQVVTAYHHTQLKKTLFRSFPSGTDYTRRLQLKRCVSAMWSRLTERRLRSIWDETVLAYANTRLEEPSKPARNLSTNCRFPIRYSENNLSNAKQDVAACRRIPAKRFSKRVYQEITSEHAYPRRVSGLEAKIFRKIPLLDRSLHFTNKFQIWSLYIMSRGTQR